MFAIQQRRFGLRSCVVSLLTLLAVTGGGPVGAENIVFPSDAGVYNVADYGAIPDDGADDTAAIQAAITDAVNVRYGVVYIPNGTYNISRRLEWKTTDGYWSSFTALQGQSQSGTILKLKDNCNGTGGTDNFTDAGNPRAVVFTASNNESGVVPDGAGNEAFHNNVRNLTVDVGSGNAGAVGVDYQVSNQGVLRDVTIKTSGANRLGSVGLNMQRANNGPGLVKNVTIDGFATGVATGGGTDVYPALTFENVTLQNQTGLGWLNESASVAVRRLRSTNAVTVIQNTGLGLFTLVDGYFVTPGGSVNLSAINNPVTGDPGNWQSYCQRIFLRNVVTKNYARVVTSRGNDVPGTTLTEWTSDAPMSLFATPQVSLNLPVRETPDYFDSNLANWKNVTSATGSTPGAHAAEDGYDDTAGIQAALNSGKSTVYLPKGVYEISNTLTIPASVKHILGFRALIVPRAGAAFGTSGSPVPFFKTAGGSASSQTTVEGIIEYPNHMGRQTPGSVGFRHDDSRTLILKYCAIAGQKYAYWTNRSGVGPLFIEDVVGGGSEGCYRIETAQNVWARQLNPESPSLKLYQNGGRVWILGLKTEGVATITQTVNNGKTEILGGNIIIQGHGDVPTDMPEFINDNSSLSLSIAGTAYADRFFTIGVRERRTTGATWKDSGRGYWRGSGAAIPLYVGYREKPSGSGAGLLATYFDNSDLTGLTFIATEPQVNLNLGTASPSDFFGMGADTFSVRWTGWIVPSVTDFYTFSFTTDDGSRLWFNNQLILDAWYDQAATTYYSSPVALTAGVAYPVRMEFYDNTGDATSQLLWSRNGATTPVLVPQTNLHRGHAQNSLTVNGSFDMETYDTGDPSGWQTTGNVAADYDADYTETVGGAHSGDRHGTHWSGSRAYNVTTYQVHDGLANGTYTLQAWVISSGGQRTAEMYVDNYGGARRSVPIPTAPGWTLVQITGIAVTNGKATIGFHSDADPYQYIRYDDAALIRE